ncbi:hypothetical protein [Demequina globuliformis]|uniref:hypothetical protein n=1 Tax=Demequina globuliformis TaxID=676202 RepID=UPI00128B906C|nr:hypothetical protein [Demequina globuliformis]
MKRAAIDCWMADQGFYPAWGNDGSYCKWHWAPYQYFRPAVDGSGGRESAGYGDVITCAAEFDRIRARIDGIASTWLDLPDGSLCDAPQQDANATAAILGTRNRPRATRRLLRGAGKAKADHASRWLA